MKHNKVDGEDLAAQPFREIKLEEIALFEMYPVGTEINVLGNRLHIVGHQNFSPGSRGVSNAETEIH